MAHGKAFRIGGNRSRFAESWSRRSGNRGPGDFDNGFQPDETRLVIFDFFGEAFYAVGQCRQPIPGDDPCAR